jgi:hypothetical protein
MKRITYVILIATLSLAVIPAQAQIGNLKNKIKDKVQSEKGKTDENKANENQTTENKTTENKAKPETALNPDGTTKTQAQAGFDPKYPPGILFSSLLTNMILHPDGNLAFNDISATFLPPAKDEKVLEPYNEKTGKKLEGVIKKADGSIHHRSFWRGKPNNAPYWLIFPVGRFVQMTPGDYVLEFLIEGTLFYRFPFSVVNETGSDDPFAKGAGDKLVLKGAWDNYAYFHLVGGNPSSNLVLKMWLRSPVKREAKVSLDIVRDGKVVATGGGAGQTFNLPIRWTRQDISFYKPNGSTIIGTDIFGKDGNYKVVVKIDDKLYGEYPFTIKDQKFVYLPEQRRGETDMKMFVEGGNDAFYIKKAK